MFWYSTRFGESVVAIEATEPIAYVQTTPDAIIQNVQMTRSAVLRGSISPYPMPVSVMTDQYRAATLWEEGGGARGVRGDDDVGCMHLLLSL